MMSFKRFFLSRLRSSAVLTLVLCLFAIITTFSAIYVYQGHEYIHMDENGYEYKEPVVIDTVEIGSFGYVAFIIGASSTLLPVISLFETKNKRNADTIYSLPVGRGKMALAYYLSGIVQMMLIYTSSFASMLIKVLTSEFRGDIASYSAIFNCYFVLALIGIAIYSMFTAIFNAANTVVDGCVFIGMWSILPGLFLMGCNEFYIKTSDIINISFINDIREEFFFPHYSFNISEHFYAKATDTILRGDYVAPAIAWSVVGVICAVIYFISFGKKRVEEIGDVSSTWFGYKLIVPMGVFSLTGAFDEIIVGLAFAFVVAVVGNMIYRRGFKFKRSDIICSAMIILISGILLMVSK